MEVLDKEVDGTNDNKVEDRPNNTKELMPKYIIIDNLLPLNFNRETLKESKIIKVISKKLVRKPFRCCAS